MRTLIAVGWLAVATGAMVVSAAGPDLRLLAAGATAAAVFVASGPNLTLGAARLPDIESRAGLRRSAVRRLRPKEA